MKIKMSKNQWEGIGKKAGWMDSPELTPDQEAARQNIIKIIDDDNILKDILDDTVSETLEANAKGYKGKGIIKEFSNGVNGLIEMYQSVLQQIRQSQQSGV